MMPRPRRASAASHRRTPRFTMRRFRRGFALPMVLMLLLISGMTIVVIMQRQTAQSRLVEEMIADYQTHHAAFGVRSIVRKWLVNKRGKDLSEFAAKMDVSYRFILPNDLFVSIWVLDGQGIPAVAPTDIGAANLAYYREIVDRVRAKHDGSLRTRGSALLSIASAPRYVLEALVEDEEQGQRLAERIIAARERKPIERDELMNQLRRSGLADDEIARIIAISTFDPVLWRVNVMSEDRAHKATRYFVMRAELTAGVLSVRSWEELIGTDPGDPFAEKPTKTNPEDDETADLNDNNHPDDQNDPQTGAKGQKNSSTR